MILEKSSHLIDLVLLDLVMPGIDGFEVLRRRQTMDAFKDIPVIVLTSSNSIEFQTEAFELGADEFIIKPVDARIALSRVNNTLGVKSRLQSSLDEQNVWKIKSQIDEMTRLFNKVTIANLVTETLTNAPSALHALMVIDIDNFKSANDIYGHTVGDHIICVIAGVISSQFRNTDFVTFILLQFVNHYIPFAYPGKVPVAGCVLGNPGVGEVTGVVTSAAGGNGILKRGLFSG